MGLGAALFGLGFLMAQKIWAEYRPPPKPSIWAVPGAVISTGSAVTIFCRTPPEVTRVRLTHFVPNEKWFDCTPQGAQEVFEFSLQDVTHTNAGVYYCEYSKGGKWSQISDKVELVVTGPPPQPSIWAVPGAVIPTGSAVTIFCRTPPGVTRVRLTHYVPDRKWFDRTPQEAQEVFEFHLQVTTQGNAGVYSCSYSKGGEWSQNSDKVELVVTGVYKEKPSLTVDSGPQRFSERNVTLRCYLPYSFVIFLLCRGGNASFPQNCSQQDHNTFLIPSVSPGHRTTYRCFGCLKKNFLLCSLPSDPLEFSTPGPLPQPSIWAVPGAVISTGGAVTIFCRTPPGVTHVRLIHNVSSRFRYDRTLQGAQEVFEFSLQNMTRINAGDYLCEYSKGGEWSQISDKLELVVTDVYKEKPSLIVDSGPQGFSERNVTLLCHTHNHLFEIFILCRGGNASFPQNCSQQDRNTFLISPVSPGHRTTYRCFGCLKPNSLLCSLPSDPLEFSIPGPSVPLVVWVSVAAVCFLLLLLFICLCCYWAKCRAKNGKTRSQVKYESSSTAMDIKEKHKYGDLEGIQPEECRKVDTQVSAAEDSQEVTYAQLRQENFRKSVDPLPPNTLQDTSTQTCVYATLTLSQEESQS